MDKSPLERSIILAPKRPASSDWRHYDNMDICGYPAERWVSRSGFIAISAVEVVNETDIPQLGPEYHVSFSKNGERAPDDEMPDLLKIFDMEGADEDSHLAGIVRHYWRPVAEKYADYVCACKTDELKIVEGNYVWRKI